MDKVKPFITVLHDCANEMVFDKERLHIINKEDVIDNIINQYHLEYDAKNSLSLNDENQYQIHFSIKGISIVDLFFSLVWDDNVDRAIKGKLPLLSITQIEDTLFSIGRLLDSFRFDIRKELSDEDWYLLYNGNHHLMINKLYFLESLKNYLSHEDLTNVYSAYLSATSSASNGGLQTIKNFDLKIKDGQLYLLILGSDITYLDFIDILKNLPETYDVLLAEYEDIGFTNDDVRLLLSIVWRYFISLKISKNNIQSHNYHTQIPQEKIGRRLHFKEIVWQNTENFRYYECCIFTRVDFSNFELNSDFIDCEFIECNFMNTTIDDYYTIVRFPLLKPRFINCINLPTDDQFLSLL